VHSGLLALFGLAVLLYEFFRIGIFRERVIAQIYQSLALIG
jgi:hypothetical protein